MLLHVLLEGLGTGVFPCTRQKVFLCTCLGFEAGSKVSYGYVFVYEQHHAKQGFPFSTEDRGHSVSQRG